MGNCCGGAREKQPYDNFNSGSAHVADTQQDREARLRAAEQAAARQAKFEQSAVGRAAIKSVKEAKRQEVRDRTPVTASDWQS